MSFHLRQLQSISFFDFGLNIPSSTIYKTNLKKFRLCGHVFQYITIVYCNANFLCLKIKNNICNHLCICVLIVQIKYNICNHLCICILIVQIKYNICNHLCICVLIVQNKYNICNHLCICVLIVQIKYNTMYLQPSLYLYFNCSN